MRRLRARLRTDTGPEGVAHESIRMRWVIAGLIMLLGLPAARGDAYRWTDAQGQVHYGDRPAGAPARALGLPGAPAPDAAAAERRARQQRLLDALAQERREAQERAERTRGEAEARASRCAQARERVGLIETAGRLYEVDASGDRRYLNDESRARTLARARAAVDQWCR